MYKDSHTVKLYSCFGLTLLLTVVSYRQLLSIQHSQQDELDARKILLDQRQLVLDDLEQRLVKLESK